MSHFGKIYALQSRFGRFHIFKNAKSLGAAEHTSILTAIVCSLHATKATKQTATTTITDLIVDFPHQRYRREVQFADTL
jgi:hypothetical protein